MLLSEYQSSGKVFIIAEIAQAHDGSFGILSSMVRSAASAGVDAVKFQMHIAEAESSQQEPFRKRFSKVDKSRFDYWKRMELSFDQWKELKNLCAECGVEFLVTPFSNTAVEMLEMLDVQRFKVGSGDLTNILMLRRLADLGKEVILSTGLSTTAELDLAVDILQGKRTPFSILQCTTEYPTSADQIGLGRIPYFRERYGCPVGLSDHSGQIFPGIGAAAIGATIIEAHITFDKRMFGPDATSSLNVTEFETLVSGVRFIEKSLGMGPEKDQVDGSEKLREIFGRSLAVNKNLAKGTKITLSDLEGKKPSSAGIPVQEIDNILGKKLIVSKEKWDFLQKNDFEFD